MRTLYYFPLLLACIIGNCAAQVLLKYGIQRLGAFDLALKYALPVFFKSLRNPYILGGLGCYIVSFVSWFLALSRLDVSLAYPLTSVGYILTLFVGAMWLNESVSLTRIMGVVVIIVGVCLVARS